MIVQLDHELVLQVASVVAGNTHLGFEGVKNSKVKKHLVSYSVSQTAPEDTEGG